jgi:hypothetical protein
MSVTAAVGVGARRRVDWSALVTTTAWLVDAALQYQPYMFHAEFVTQTLEPTIPGTPYFVAHPGLWADHFMLHHIGLYNVGFATVQLLIALAIFYRPTVRLGLAVSFVWALGVWWLAEGIGGVTNGASPIAGAPGAVVLYALIAVLVWPTGRTDGGPSVDGPSVAESSPLGTWGSRATWLLLWGGLIALGLEAANRSPSALHDAIAGTESGEPGWIRAIDRALVSPLAHHGTEVSIGLAVLYAFAGLGILSAATRRPAVVVAVLLGVGIWLAEDFGGIATGSATDVNSGPLIMLLAATFWPVAGSRLRSPAARSGISA